jgi:hypothetical protein
VFLPAHSTIVVLIITLKASIEVAAHTHACTIGMILDSAYALQVLLSQYKLRETAGQRTSAYASCSENSCGEW